MDLSNVLNDTLTLVLLSVLVLSLVALSLHYGLIWMRVGARRAKKDKLDAAEESAAEEGTAAVDERLPSVSVVIVASNEAESLKNSLPYLLEQDYPDFEIVVVDYMSRDDTPFVLRVCSENYPNLKPVNFREDVNMFRGKKYPLSIGIQSASKDIILLTDAGAVPASFLWIRDMVRAYGNGTDIVAGSAALTEKGTLLNALEQYDNLVYNASYIGMAMLGKPYTASGRNLSYRKDFFFKQGGFISHYSIPDGADDLFVNQNAGRKNTAVALGRNASMVCEARDSVSLWRRDRRQRMATRRYYSVKDKLVVNSYPVAQVLFLASLVWLWVAALFPWQILAAVLFVKLAWQISCSAVLAKRFSVKKIRFLSPIFELYFLFSDTILAISSLRKKKSPWR